MIGAYDYCGHYEWTYAWLEGERGPDFLREYWETAISRDSRRHTRAMIAAGGFDGMRQYWGQALDEEEAGYAITQDAHRFRIDMHACPSKGFLIRNGLQQYPDYCDHCIGWIGPVMAAAGFVVDHQHNHRGKCWWEMRRHGDASPASQPGEFAGEKDVRAAAGWESPDIDAFWRATNVRDKASQ
jgi:hypothetical protein